jgi:alpha-glucosidase (family GH31 glycosyl hydrolase)
MPFLKSDVLKYEIGNSMAMDQVIPFLIAINNQQTIGLLWNNSSET